MQRIFYSGANAQISAVVLGDSNRPPLITLHGLRDHALGMFELLEPLSRDFYVIAMDLRGHGHSDKVHTYTMIQFMADLKALYDHFGIESAALIGHSLGGHITMRFAATYPNLVNRLVLLDGMGPPGDPDGKDPADIQTRLQFHMDTVAGITGQRRSIASMKEARRRLRQNNPLMSDGLLDLIVEEGTESHEQGGVKWRWESAVNMVWSTFSHVESEALLPLIESPVLIVTGDRGLEYWVQMRPEIDDQSFYESELKRRRGLFRDAQHVLIKNAGHMLHYDQPKAVYEQVIRFLANR